MPGIDASKPHIARIYDYWLGGTDNFAVDREAAELAVAASPTVLPRVRANRRFLGRAVRYMTEAGVRQFLDIGTGIPSANNTHQVATGARVLYVDNDPVVLVHARALLENTTAPTAYINADARDTATILAAAAEHLDLEQPVGVMLLAVLHCVPADDDPYGLVASYLDAVPPGSYLAISHPAIDQVEAAAQAQDSLSRSMGAPVTFRTRDQVGRFFDGLDLVEPGVVPVQEWRPSSPLDLGSLPTAMWGGLAVKP